MSPRNPNLVASLVSLPFVLCVGVLAAAAIGRATLVHILQVVTRKERIDLRKPLAVLPHRFGDYQLNDRKPDKGRIRLSAEMEDALGTDTYVNWWLVDASVERKNDPRRHAQLFVTYYTGGPNLAPHTPDVCYIAGGYQPQQAHETRELELPSLYQALGTIPVRVCTFVKTAIFDWQQPTVVYTFHANGGFTASRTGVRSRTRSLRDRYAYFSKVEVSFGGPGCRPPNLGREESVQAAAKLLDAVLPILIEEHWPDRAAMDRPVAPGNPPEEDLTPSAGVQRKGDPWQSN